MKSNRILLIGIILLAIFTLGCASAADENIDTADEVLTTDSVGELEVTQEDSPAEHSCLVEDCSEEILKENDNTTIEPIHFYGTTMTELSNTINNAHDGDVIYFEDDIEQDNDAGTYIMLNKHITIDGNDHSIDLKGISYAFRVHNTNVTLMNMIIENGYASQNGGAIYLTNAGSCTLINCTFISNVAGTYGGAIYAASLETCNFTGCSFINNTAMQGAGVYITNQANVKDCNFTDNSVLNNVNNAGARGAAFYGSGRFNNCSFIANHAQTAKSYGGALYIKYDSTLINCSFTGNTAELNGGAVYTESGTILEIDNCNFSNNQAQGDSGCGGALYTNTPSNLINDCIFFNNNANTGGAIYSYTGDCNLNGCGFIGNHANSDGGAVYGQMNYNVVNCTFMNNSAGRSGGTIFSRQGCNISNSSFENNTAGSHGGAVYVKMDSILMNCSFINNAAEKSGGSIYAESGTVLKIIDCNFNNNTAKTNGGAVYSNMTSNLINDCSFTNNSAENVGGAVYTTNGVCSLSDCNFTDNSAGTCGALYGECSLSNCSFTNNRASTGDGGAIYSQMNSNISSCIFINNTAGRNGGAIFSREDSNEEGCYFADNVADSYGGAIYVANHANLNNCSLISNKANYGGAIHSRSTGALTGCNFINNSAQGGNSLGGAIYSETYVNLINCNFTGNNAKHGGAIYSSSTGSCDMSDCNFINNTAIQGAGVYSFNQANVNNCNFTDNSVSNNENDDGARGSAFYGYSAYFNDCNFQNNHGLTNKSYGGAVYVKYDSVFINCNFTDNSAEVSGGALYAGFGTILEITNCSFINNSAPGDNGYGGAVFSNVTFDSISGCVFIDNYAVNTGGAIYSAIGDCNLSNTLFYNNTAGNIAGAVYTYNGVCELSNCDFTNNTAGSCGAFYGDGTIISSIFIDNHAIADDGDGGAIYSLMRSYANDCIFINNTAGRDGGAVYSRQNSDVENCNFANGSAGHYGGAIYIKHDSIIINCSYSDNSAGLGGAIYADSGIVLEISNCSFTNNHAINTTSGDGGAIYNKMTSDSISNCSFTNNTASRNGGAINSPRGNCSLINCSFTSNVAGNSAGAIHSGNGNCNLSNCNFANNTAGNTAGALYSTNGVCDLRNCDFNNNTADSCGAFYGDGALNDCIFTNNRAANDGGAIYSQQGCNANDCIFANNSAGRDGGAIYSRLSSNSSNCNFTNNSAGRYGGAIHIKENSTLINSNFTGNAAETLGGAVYAGSGTALDISDCSFTNNHAINVTSGDGGAIYSNMANDSISNCILVNNSAGRNGGAINSRQNSSLNSCNFTNNSAGRYGGAVYTKQHSNMIACNFKDNTAEKSGGAVYTESGDALEISNCIFTNNGATATTTSDGGAIYSGMAYNSISNCSFTNNSAVRNGGAIYSSGSNFTLSSCIFEENNAENIGGAINTANGNCNLNDCNFTNNTAGNTAGAVYTTNGICDLSNCNFNSNTAESCGAFYGDGTLNNSSFTNNHATTSDGGAIYTQQNCNLNDCIFTNNSAGRNGGAIYSRQGSNSTNCNFTNNTAGTYGGGIYKGDASNCCFVNCSSANAGSAIYQGNAYDSIFIDCYNERSIVNGNSTNCTFAESPALYCPDVTVEYGQTAMIPVRILDKDGNDVNGFAVDAEIYRENVLIDCLETLSGSNITLDLDIGNYILALTSDYYIAPCNASLIVEKLYPGLEIEATPITAGETASITVTMAENATGYVNISVNNQIYTVEIISGEASVEVAGLAAGDHEVTAIYGGDETYEAETATATLTVAKPSPFISAPGVTAKYGEDANITVYLASDVPGNVKITINKNTQKAPIKNGVATLAVSGLKSGLYPVDISYGGNYKYCADTINTTLEVEKNTPITSIVADSITYGDNATVTVNVAPNVPGNIQITVNGVAKRVPITNGAATATFSGLKAKSYEVTAKYGGNVNYVSQTKTTTLTVAKATPIISVDAPDAVFGSDATITVNLCSDVPGNVRVTINGNTQKAAIKSGVATYTVSGLKAGSHEVTVNYAGNANYNAQTVTATLNIAKAAPIASVSVEDIHVGDAAVIIVKTADNVNGNIKINVNGAEQKVKIVNGMASLNVTGLKAGTYEVSASYAGNANFEAQTATTSFDVTKSSPGLSMSVSTENGQTTVTANIAQDAPGNVKVIVDGATTYTARITNGVATYTIPGLAAGKHTIKVTYGGNYKYTAQSRTKTITI